jgi:5-methylcytosine-specific restriction endonuclease McrA
VAQPQRKAQFFVDVSGVVVPKANPLTASERKRVFERDSKTCQKCRTPVRFGGKYDHPFSDQPKCGEVDHVIPRSRGGQNDDGNLRLLCKSCNAAKGSK